MSQDRAPAPRRQRRHPRASGEGTVHQRPDGRWEGRVDLGYQRGPDGRRRRARKSFYGKTRRAVIDQMEDFRADLRAGISPAGKQLLLGDWLQYWLEHVIKANREPTTYELYEVLVRRHITPRLGDIRLDRLRTEDIERWRDGLERAGVGLRTRQSALLRLRTALTVAVQRRHIGANPAEHVEPPRGPRRAKRPPPDLADARQLLATFKDNPLLRAFTLLWLGVGLRRGETLGLRWDDIDFDNGYVLVQRRVNRVHGQGLLVREGAKSNEGNRAQPLARIALEALIDRRRQQREDRLRAGANWKGTADGYVFTTRIGTLIEPRNVNRAFTAALRRAGLEHRSPHSLRHDFAGLLLSSGVASRVTQELMRHTRYERTANVYQQPPDELLRLATAQIDRALGYGDAEG
jgi:integrase